MLKEEDLSKFELRENGTVVLAYNEFQALMLGGLPLRLSRASRFFWGFEGLLLGSPTALDSKP